MPPETRYAKSGDVHIAYQVTGRDGPDLLLVPGWVSHVEYAWEEPSYSRFLGRLASFSRLILMDRRGTGLSDPVAELPTLEQRMEDVRAVMDAAGSERAVLFGISEGGPMCMLFAATYPERTTSLVLFGTFAKPLGDAGFPLGPTREVADQWLEQIAANWGKGLTARAFAPSRADDAAFVESWARFERRAVSPGGARRLIGMLFNVDVRQALPTISAPTLVLHRTGDPIANVVQGRFLAENIAGARFVELPGDDHFGWVGDTDALLDEVEEFVTGARGTKEVDRVLATVLFTDVVDSTRRAAELGDRRWRELLERYHATTRRELERFRGREIDTAGDGFFATFDGPARAIRCACALRDALGALDIPIRAGLHTGECEVHDDKVSGIAVHTGARVAASAQPGEVFVSSTVKDLVAGSGLRFEERGVHELKGVPGEWRLFAVVE